MQSSRSARLGRLLAALLAVFAFGTITAASASAEETKGPSWTINGSKLPANETRLFTIRAYEGTTSPVALEAELLGVKLKIECHLTTVAPGAILIGGAPGTGEGSPELSDCTTVNNGTGCKVKEPIKMERTRLELVVSDEGGRFGKFVLVEFDPATGTEGSFGVVKFVGAGCVFAESELSKGLVVGSEFTDTKPAVQVETLGTPEASSFLIKFPDEFTDNGGIKSIWLFKNNVFELVKITLFKFLGNEGRLNGTWLILLLNGEKFGQKV
jgi:hypothetical protein